MDLPPAFHRSGLNPGAKYKAEWVQKGVGVHSLNLFPRPRGLFLETETRLPPGTDRDHQDGPVILWNTPSKSLDTAGHAGEVSGSRAMYILARYLSLGSPLPQHQHEKQRADKYLTILRKAELLQLDLSHSPLAYTLRDFVDLNCSVLNFIPSQSTTHVLPSPSTWQRSSQGLVTWSQRGSSCCLSPVVAR